MKHPLIICPVQSQCRNLLQQIWLDFYSSSFLKPESIPQRIWFYYLVLLDKNPTSQPQWAPVAHLSYLWPASLLPLPLPLLSSPSFPFSPFRPTLNVQGTQFTLQVVLLKPFIGGKRRRNLVAAVSKELLFINLLFLSFYSLLVGFHAILPLLHLVWHLLWNCLSVVLLPSVKISTQRCTE
jgi:hypothetical protein